MTCFGVTGGVCCAAAARVVWGRLGCELFSHRRVSCRCFMCQEKAAPGWEGAWLHNRTVRARGHGAEGLCSLGAWVGHCWWEQMWESAGGNEYWDQVGKGKAGRKCVSSELCECHAGMEREVRRPWMARAGRKVVCCSYCWPIACTPAQSISWRRD